MIVKTTFARERQESVSIARRAKYVVDYGPLEVLERIDSTERTFGTGEAERVELGYLRRPMFQRFPIIRK